jgi:hypothetical protein
VAEGNLPPRLKQKFIIGQFAVLYVAMLVEVECVLAIGRRVRLLSEQFYFNIGGTVEKYVIAKLL